MMGVVLRWYDVLFLCKTCAFKLWTKMSNLIYSNHTFFAWFWELQCVINSAGFESLLWEMFSVLPLNPTVQTYEKQRRLSSHIDHNHSPNIWKTKEIIIIYRSQPVLAINSCFYFNASQPSFLSHTFGWDLFLVKSPLCCVFSLCWSLPPHVSTVNVMPRKQFCTLSWPVPFTHETQDHAYTADLSLGSIRVILNDGFKLNSY